MRRVEGGPRLVQLPDGELRQRRHLSLDDAPDEVWVNVHVSVDNSVSEAGGRLRRLEADDDDTSQIREVSVLSPDLGSMNKGVAAIQVSCTRGFRPA